MSGTSLTGLYFAITTAASCYLRRQELCC